MDEWGEARAAGAGRPSVVVKAVDGSTGRGAGVLIVSAGTLPAQAPFAGPYLVQDYVPNDGRDRKVYVVGDRIGGLLKRRAIDCGTAAILRGFAPGHRQAAIARRAGAALGLEIYGVDLLEGPDGPVLVDVNAFPSCRGLPGAAERIADHLRGAARGG